MTQDDATEVRIAGLGLYPIKSCAGLWPAQALLIETGLEFDRTWMVVDGDGEMLTQRDLPRMALVSTRLRHGDLVLRAPGMLALHLALDAAEEPCRVRVWNDELPAYDMGALAAQWFSDFLRQPVRLARFDPDSRRRSDPRWSGGVEALNTFSDGFPLLVASQASLDELNRRLAQRGESPVTMARFRPNLILEGVEPHGEDHLRELRFETDDGPVRLRLVKPCARCPIPDIDPGTAEPGHAVGDVLASYRADAKLAGALTFGMNAIVLEGVERTLTVGQVGQATFAFD